MKKIKKLSFVNCGYFLRVRKFVVVVSLLGIYSFIYGIEREIPRWDDLLNWYVNANTDDTLNITGDITFSVGLLRNENWTKLIIRGWDDNESMSIQRVFDGNKMNTADENAQFSLSNKQITFKNITFKNFFNYIPNKQSNGGAIYAANSTVVIFNGLEVEFINNISSGGHVSLQLTGQGGAIYSHGSKIIFNSEIVNFTSNSAFAHYNQQAFGYGGAIFAYKSTISFDSKSINFTNNSAVGISGWKANGQGGAIYAMEKSMITFNAQDINFTSNTAFSVFSHGTLLDSYASGGGGAIYVSGNSVILINSQTVNFTSNTVYALVAEIVRDAKGGAIFVQSSVITFNSQSVNFIGNSVFESGTGVGHARGGAIFADKSTITIENAKFYDNTADTQGGAIYIDGSDRISKVEIRAISRDVVFSGNKANDIDNDIYIEKDSNLILYAGFNKKIEMNGGITGTADNNIIRKTGRGDLALDGITNFEGEMIIEEGTLKVKASSITIGTLEILNNAILDVEVDWEVDYINLANIIIVNDMIIEDQAKIKLNVFKNPEVLGSSLSVIYTVEGNGEFKVVTEGRYGYKFQWDMQSGIINGQQYEKIGNIIYMGKYDKGVFLANAISNSARPVGVDSLYERIGTSDRVWFEVYVQEFKANGTENSVGDFKVKGNGLRAGLDIYAHENSTLGLYMRYGINNMEQEKDKADMQDLEFGLYGGLFQYKNIRLKGNLSFGLEQFDTKSEMYLINGTKHESNIPTQKAKFNTQSIKIGGQIEYTAVDGKVEIRPFIGLQGGYVHNGEIKEDGGGASDLKVSANHYERLEGLFGIGIGNGIGEDGLYPSFIWNAKVYGGYLILNKSPKYEVSYYKDNADTEGNFELIGVKKEQARAGLALRVEYLISRQIAIYSNFNKSYASNESEYNVNLGLEYRFVKVSLKRNHLKPKVVNPKTIKKESIKTRVEEFRLAVARFEPNKIELIQKYKDLIKEVAREIKYQEYERIIIVGNADKSEKDHNYENLSEERARIVADEFIKNGLEEKRIEFIVFESKHPTEISNEQVVDVYMEVQD